MFIHIPSFGCFCKSADYIFNFIFLNKDHYIFIEISLKSVPNGPVDHKSAPIRRLGIIWTYAPLVYWFIYASFHINEATALIVIYQSILL